MISIILELAPYFCLLVSIISATCILKLFITSYFKNQTDMMDKRITHEKEQQAAEFERKKQWESILSSKLSQKKK